MMRVNHEYQRGGALAYLAAYDVHRAHVFGHCSPKTGIEPFTTLVDKVMTQEPYVSAKRVFWVVDNCSSHRGQAAIDRAAKRYPNAVMVHTPVHASWINQIEIFFPSSSARSSHPTTSPALTRSKTGSSPSSGATTGPPGPSNGSSPRPTSRTYWPGSSDTNRKSRTFSSTMTATISLSHSPKDLQSRPL
ncbi:transposase [Nonomuraea jabiensis]|uniref:transposase n=1 Tax=Nonomuraea jabiensis TaxID=882448 RepID=UPI00369E8065